MMLGPMETVFRPDRLDAIFADHSKVQYERELLFSNLVNLLSLVVCGIHPSVNAAYKAKVETLNVNRSAVYQELNGVEIGKLAHVCGGVESGELFEQLIRLEYKGETLRIGRIVLRLLKATRHEESEIVILSNLPVEVASATLVSQLYRKRWQIEELF